MIRNDKMQRPGRGRVLGRLSLMAVAVAMSAQAQAQTYPEAWLGGTGSWFDPQRWSTNDLPGINASVLIQGTLAEPAVVTVDKNLNIFSFRPTAASLDIGPQARLVVKQSFNIPQDVVNAGRLDIETEPNSFVSTFNVQGKLTLASGGSTYLSGRSSISSSKVILQAGHVLSGSGNVSAGYFLNEGLIDANSGPLAIGVSSSLLTSQIINNGVLRASNGGTLSLWGVVQNNQPVIELNNGGLVALDMLIGGTILAQGTDSAVSGTLRDVTLQGKLRSTHLDGTFTNNASIDLVQDPASSYGPWLGSWNSMPALIDGNGEINVKGALPAQLYGLTLGAGQTFRGSAVIQGAFTNLGRVVVQGASGLSTDYQAPTLVNRGLIEVASGSVLQLSTGLDNQGGVLLLNTGSQLVASRVVSGGVLQAATPVELRNSQTFSDLTLKGHWSLAPGAILRTQGTLEIQDTLTIDNVGSDSKLVLVGDTRLSGKGHTVVSDTWSIENDQPNYTNRLLTIGADHTLRGGGVVSARLLNEGVIQVDAWQDLQISGGYELTNRGVIRTAGGATLRLFNELDNHGGLMVLGDGGRLLAGASITGGTLRGGNQSEALLQASELRDITLTGRLTATAVNPWSPGLVGLSGTVTNQGLLTVSPNGGLRVAGAATLDGAGRTELQGGQGQAVIEGQNGSDSTLTIGKDQAVVGHGWTTYASVVNRGQWGVQGGDLQMYNTPQLVNEGILRITQGNALLSDARLVQRGAVSSLVIEGRLSAPGVDIQSGVVQGGGVIEGDLNMQAATLNISASTGVLSVTGDLSLSDDSNLVIDLSTAADAQLNFNVGGKASLAGLLSLNFGPQVQAGDSFTLLSGGGLLSGVFRDVVVRGTDLQVAVSYAANGVKVAVVPEPATWAFMLMGMGALAWVRRRA